LTRQGQKIEEAEIKKKKKGTVIGATRLEKRPGRREEGVASAAKKTRERSRGGKKNKQKKGQRRGHGGRKRKLQKSFTETTNQT